MGVAFSKIHHFVSAASTAAHGAVHHRHTEKKDHTEQQGRTLYYLIDILKKRNPKSVHLCTLLDKPERRVCDVKVDYTCFNIPDEFVVGYGLDYAQKYRNLPYIGVVEFHEDEE